MTLFMCCFPFFCFQVQKPSHGGAGGGGHSAFLQKRLAKGQKYFDSGDYQMAKQKTRVGGGVPPPMAGRSSMAVPVLSGMPTGDTIPTPDTVPARKSSIIQPIHDASRSMHVPSDPGTNPKKCIQKIQNMYSECLKSRRSDF